MADTNEPMSDEQIDTVLEAARLNGRGCVCHAYGAHECACGAVWLDSFAPGVIRAINQLRAENAELQKIVDRLPKTADGVPVCPGDSGLWGPDADGEIVEHCTGSGYMMTEGGEYAAWHIEERGGELHDILVLAHEAFPDEAYYGDVSACYSTREAAEAALAARNDTTDDE